MNKPVTELEVERVVHDSLAAALAAAQGELRNPEKKKTATVQGETKAGKKYDYKFKYADIADVLEASLPVLSRHGLALSQPTYIEDGAIYLKTQLLHTSGEVLESVYPVCSLNVDHKKMGAAMTYARRYAFTSLIGVSAVEDTDGQGAAPSGGGPRKKMTANEAKKEVDWSEVEKSIDACETFSALDKREARIEERKDTWPNTYYWKAKERVQNNRLEMLDGKFAACDDADSLSGAFADLEVELEGKVSYDELAAAYQKHQTRLEDGL